jgi:hypothetical protein
VRARLGLPQFASGAHAIGVLLAALSHRWGSP